MKDRFVIYISYGDVEIAEFNQNLFNGVNVSTKMQSKVFCPKHTSYASGLSMQNQLMIAGGYRKDLYLQTYWGYTYG